MENERGKYFATYECEPFNPNGSYFDTILAAREFLAARGGGKIVDTQTGEEVSDAL